MQYEDNLVSIIIPTYKRSDMLTRAIESVLGQTYKNVECIVVNDNTPGDEYSRILYEMLQQYKQDSRFHFIEQEVHKNGAAARNAGIRAAKGEFIAFLDDDDFWDKNKLDIQVPVIQQLTEDWGAVGCLMRYYKNGKVVAANRPYKDGYIHYGVLTRCTGLGTGSLIIRRRALDQTGYFDENLKRFQDPQLFSSLTEKYKVKLIRMYLHNRDIDDSQNRPTINNINALQDAYFKSVSGQLERLPKRKVKLLKTIFQFDKAPIYWREGEKKKSILLTLSVFKYPETIYFAVKRITERYLSHMHVKERLMKYGDPLVEA